MSQEGNATLSPAWREFFGFGIYKRSQGRIARQATFAALVLIIAAGTWSLNGMLLGVCPAGTRFAICGAVLAVGAWVSFRLVNWPRFADFLISVEAEMNKVSWPTRTELFRATIVVIVTMFGLAILLFSYDVVWRFLLGPSGLNIMG
jgi:preprotein translocase subunit SecE